MQKKICVIAPSNDVLQTSIRRGDIATTNNENMYISYSCVNTHNTFAELFGDGRNIFEAGTIYIWYQPNDDKIRFLLGMIFMRAIIIGPESKMILLNRDEVEKLRETDQFADTVLALTA
ncbi:MAG: hypothetical protein HYW78_01660 [Parcubacteria group bacterium]|nr:hypothetical protein [Parcubacteria group bacterium]